MSDMRLQAKLGERTVVVDLLDLNGVEWREVKKLTGLSPKQALESVTDLDFDAVAAIIWVWRLRDEPNLGFEDVLRECTLATFIDQTEGAPASDEEVEGDDPPD